MVVMDGAKGKWWSGSNPSICKREIRRGRNWGWRWSEIGEGGVRDNGLLLRCGNFERGRVVLLIH